MADTPTLARFVTGWAEDGTGDDGLPRYRETIKIIKERPPYLRVEFEATEADFEDYPGPWALFQKEQAARRAAPTASGFPLALWPAVNAAELKMLSARDVITIEQLAKFAERGGGGEGMPAELKELAQRAKQMIAMTKDIGQYEARERDLVGQIEALKEQVEELRATIKSQDGIINSLKMRVA